MTNFINNDKIELGFDELDIAMEKIVNEHKLNFYGSVISNIDKIG